jgi:23S rRNA maturation mini-RNase III
LCGAHGIRATKPEKLRAALDAALAYEGTALIEIITDAELIWQRSELHRSFLQTAADIGLDRSDHAYFTVAQNFLTSNSGQWCKRGSAPRQPTTITRCSWEFCSIPTRS